MAESTQLSSADHDALVRIEVLQSRMADDVRQLTELVKTTNKNHEDRIIALELWRHDHSAQRKWVIGIATAAAAAITSAYEIVGFLKNVHK